MAQIKSDKKLKISYIPYYGYETNNLAFSDENKRRWTNVLKEKLEKEGHSIATYDINTIKDSDYIISFDNTYFQNVRHFWNIWRAGKLGRTLHIDYEPPSAMIRIHSDKGLKILSKLFTIMTYNDNVVNGRSIVKGVVGDYHEKEKLYKSDYGNRKLLCMVANNRNSIIPIKPWPYELYSEREKAAIYFSNMHAEDFDLYGDYWPDSVKTKGVVERNKKIDTLSQYRFVVSYDSIANQNGYISEKIFDIFAAKSVPVYLGADNVLDYIPKECFIDRRDFSTDEDVFRYMKNMTKKDYESRIREIEKYLKSDSYKNVFSSEAIADNIIDNFIYKKPRQINYFTALCVLLWFTYIYRTNKYYSYDNYFFDISKKILKNSIFYVDKAIEDGKPVFRIHANMEKTQTIYTMLGQKDPVKVKTKFVSSSGIYNKIIFVISYHDIVMNKRVSIFTKNRNILLPLKLNQSEIVNKTNYEDTTGFAATGNKIVYVRRPYFYISKVRRLLPVERLLSVKKYTKKTYKPEIVYYPHIAEPAIDKDGPFNLDMGTHSWEQQLRIIADRHGIEVHTPDKAKFKNVIGVLFFNNLFYCNLSDLQKLHNKHLLEKTIYIDYEPPTGHAKKHEPESMKKIASMFKAVATYDDDLAGNNNFIKANVANFYEKQPKRQDFSKKKFAIMVTNNTTPNKIASILNYWNNTDYYNDSIIKYHKKAIYHKRLEIVEYFYENHPDKLDLYGTGFPGKYHAFNKGFLNRSKKISIMNGYRFTFALDSYTDQNGYISEKIFDAFFAKTIPVYLGASNISEYIPKDCFIDMRNFNKYEDLYVYLSKIGPKEYNKRIDSIETFLKSKKFKDFFSSKATATRLFDAVISNAPIKYNYVRAKQMLDKLESEKNKLSTDNVFTSRVDRELLDKHWSFVVSVRPGKYTGTLLGKIYAVGNGKKVKIKTFRDKHEELRGNTCMVIPYEDIRNMGKMEFFIDKNGGDDTKLIFSHYGKEIINNTHLDNQTGFLVKENSISRKQLQQKDK